MPVLAAALLARSLHLQTQFSISLEQTSRQVRALQPAPTVLFGVDALAHPAGVNALVVDRFDGRLYVAVASPSPPLWHQLTDSSLVSGAADGGISLWDIQAGEESAFDREEAIESEKATIILHRPLATCKKSPESHSYGITSLHFYPFDSLAFLSSSYDHTLKLWSSTTLQPYASFSLSSVIYNAAVSPIATHLLVACATQHPAVRLIDLRSGAATHSLAGHQGGSVLSVSWNPQNEHVISSGGADGTVRLWDVRQSASCLGTLDLEDSVGLVAHHSSRPGPLSKERGKAHTGPVNGIVWTDDAKHIVTTGHDEKIRVWDAYSGANTLVNFGPKVRNRNFAPAVPVITPKGLLPTGQEILFHPNDKEILMFDMFEGKVLKRLKRQESLQARVNALAWRAHTIELFSANSDGTIRSWKPRTREDAMVEEIEDVNFDFNKRKRDVLEDIEESLRARQISFT